MTLKDFVHQQGLTWKEWLNLDKQTQQKWRKIQERKNREEQIKSNNAYKEYLRQCDKEYEAGMQLLAEIGVPFDMTGAPLGIGWDD